MLCRYVHHTNHCVPPPVDANKTGRQIVFLADCAIRALRLPTPAAQLVLLRQIFVAPLVCLLRTSQRKLQVESALIQDTHFHRVRASSSTPLGLTAFYKRTSRRSHR